LLQSRSNHQQTAHLANVEHDNARDMARLKQQQHLHPQQQQQQQPQIEQSAEGAQILTSALDSLQVEALEKQFKFLASR
jgi:hypothetical protein